MYKKARTKTLAAYIGLDLLGSILAWILFFVYRKKSEGFFSLEIILSDRNFYLGILIIPICWLLLYALFEEYGDIYRKGRIPTLSRTFFHTIMGSAVIFFALILDDVVMSTKEYYISGFRMFWFQFLTIAIIRTIVLTVASRQLKTGKVKFNTLIVGNNEKAVETYLDITNRPQSLGYEFVGYIDAGEKGNNGLEEYLPKVGMINDLPSVVVEKQVEDVIIAMEKGESKLRTILDHLFDFEDRLYIKIIPHMYDILLGQVKMNHLYGAVLIEIEKEIMPQWQRLVKRLFDIVISLLVLIIFSPLYLIIALRVKISSEGPILFKQERVGLGGKKFKIYKFRSMTVDAEMDGPQLSSDHDPRVTPWGAKMRKYRLDELPQFYNVLKGDMSIVGPRPERQFYIDQIMERSRHFKQLLKVRPGITSWGMVKYGYASNVEQMIQRLKFDLLYIENRSLALDFKILFYTILVIVKGDGK